MEMIGDIICLTEDRISATLHQSLDQRLASLATPEKQTNVRRLETQGGALKIRDPDVAYASSFMAKWILSWHQYVDQSMRVLHLGSYLSHRSSILVREKPHSLLTALSRPHQSSLSWKSRSLNLATTAPALDLAVLKSPPGVLETLELVVSPWWKPGILDNLGSILILVLGLVCFVFAHIIGPAVSSFACVETKLNQIFLQFNFPC